MTRLWAESWLKKAKAAERDLWRGVESQHRVATMRLVDDLAEQEVLESILESSKPPWRDGTAGMHYLLATPFRYTSEWPSRFRRPEEPGAWYGADEPATVAAELAHWRWRFYMDSAAFGAEPLLVEFTFFHARFRGTELDITQAPWTAHRNRWRDPDDYADCHSLAEGVHRARPPIHAIRYESARRAGAACEVVFAPSALSMPRHERQQSWSCKVTTGSVLWWHDSTMLEFFPAVAAD